MKHWLWLFLMILGMVGSAQAATKYASPTGSGSTCSVESPCSRATAISAAVCGDTVLLRGGTYNAFAISNRSCAASNRLTIKSYPGETARVIRNIPAGISASGHVIHLTNVSGFALENLEITSTDQNEIDLGDGLIDRYPGSTFNALRFQHACSDNLIRGNEIHHTMRAGIYIPTSATDPTYRNQVINNHIHHTGGYGTYISGNDFLIQGNLVTHTHSIGIRVGTETPSTNFVIENNTIHSLHDCYFHESSQEMRCGAHGIFLATQGSRAAIRGNTIYSLPGDGITTRYSNTLIYNNTVYGLTGGSSGAPTYPVWIQVGNGSIVRNNLFWSTGTIRVESGSTGHVYSNNRCSSAQAGLCAASGDPLFTNSGAGDFTLQVGSPAIDQATAVVCTAADVSAGRCTKTLAPDLVGYVGTNPDQGAREFSVPSSSDEPLTAELLLNNAVTDTSEYAKTAVNTGVTFSTTTPPEGIYWAVWDAATDRITIPTSGMSLTQGTITLSFDASAFTGAGPGARQYLLGHTSTFPSFANRIQIYETGSGQLYVGFGGTHALMANLFQMSLNTRYHAALRWNNGQVCLFVNAVSRGCASFANFSQLASTLALGNDGAEMDEGWRGRVDAVRIWNTARTDAEIDADCDALIAGGCTATEPTFVAPALQTGWTTDTTGLIWTGSAHATGPVDPGVLCAMSGGEAVNLTATYSSGVQPKVIGCSVGANGFTATMTVDVPPASGAVTVTLQYSADTPVSVTNAFTGGGVPATGITQASYQCRAPSDDDLAPLWGLPNVSCRDVNASSPGRVSVPMTIVNDSGGTLTEFETGLKCKLNAGAEFRVGVDFGGNPVRYLLTGAGLSDNTAFTDRQLLPTPAGKAGTDFIRRVVRRSDNESPVNIPNGKYFVNEWYLEIASGLVAGTDTLSCKTVLKDGTALASYGAADVAVAVIPIRRGRVTLVR